MCGYNAHGALGLGDTGMKVTLHAMNTLPADRKISSLSFGYEHGAALLGSLIGVTLLTVLQITGKCMHGEEILKGSLDWGII